jgi:hypothetical protein
MELYIRRDGWDVEVLDRERFGTSCCVVTTVPVNMTMPFEYIRLSNHR